MNANELDEVLTVLRKHKVHSFETTVEGNMRIVLDTNYANQTTPAPMEAVAKVLRVAPRWAESAEKGIAQREAQQEKEPKVSAADAALDVINNPGQLYPEGMPDE